MLSTNSIAVLNKDEEVFAEFKAATKARIMTYGIKIEREIMAKNIELYIDHSEFDLSLKGNLYHIVCPTIADFNIFLSFTGAISARLIAVNKPIGTPIQIARKTPTMDVKIT